MRSGTVLGLSVLIAAESSRVWGVTWQLYWVWDAMFIFFLLFICTNKKFKYCKMTNYKAEVCITWKNNNYIRLAFVCSASASFLACAFASAFLLLSSESLSTFCFLWISCCRFWSLISLAATKSVSPYVKYKHNEF